MANFPSAHHARRADFAKESRATQSCYNCHIIRETKYFALGPIPNAWALLNRSEL